MGAMCVTCQKKRVVRRLSKRFSIVQTMRPEEREKTLSNRQLVLNELIRTEQTYVEHLKKVVEGHMKLMKTPEEDTPLPNNWDDSYEYKIFGNLESIYKWHRDTFLKALERCQIDINLLGRTFEMHERRMMSMYTRYSHNHSKEKTPALIKFGEYFDLLTQKLKYSQQLDELLFKPVQRITVYHLLVDRILDSTKRLDDPMELESVQRASKVVKDLPHNINVMMKFRDIMRYKDADQDNGKLLYHGQLLCAEIEGENSKKRWSNKNVYFKGELFMVYLFEKNIMFNVVVGKNAKNNEPRCFYRNHIPVNNMLFGRFPNCENTFTITSMSVSFDTKRNPDAATGRKPKGECLAYTCRAKTTESFTEWMNILHEVTEQQYQFAVDLQNPILAQKTSRPDSWS